MKRPVDFSGFLIFDGAMGTMLQTYGLKAGQPPESYNILHPEIIERIHREYLAAGADVITTNTFGANRYKLEEHSLDLKQVIKSGVEIALKAARDMLVALDLGPIGLLMEPHGTLAFEEAYEIFKEQIIAGAQAGADLILIETMSDIYEVKAAILAAKENCRLPIFCTMTFDRDGRTLTGTDPLTMVNIVQGLGVDALGLNCSLGPKEILPLIEDIVKFSKVPVIAQPNAGLPKVINGKTLFDIEPKEFAEYAKALAEKGVTILGGCCGTNPNHIKALKEELTHLKPVKRKIRKITAASSSSKTVILDQAITVIGEKLNPTGRKALKTALKNHDIDYVLREAVKQRDAGAHILNINTGLPEINEKAAMIKVVKEIQSIINLPLQIDSGKKDVIEAAVRIYNGKPIINSVSGKRRVMEDIFPIAKKYGACVVCLTLDEKGIPEKAEDRLKIAEKIVKTAEEYGIAKEDLIIDCLVITASAQQEEVKETVKALRLVKEKLGVKTTLGISNVSHGLPERKLLNRTFLAMTLAAGLDAPILDPLDKEMIATINAFNVLWGNDDYAKNYIATYGSTRKSLAPTVKSPDINLQDIVINGLKEEALLKIKAMLEIMSSTKIIDDYLIPSLDIVGRKYEEGEIFLPQLIQSAETVKKAFDEIKNHMAQSSGEKMKISKGKIILATVRGDIHDIGKNIVKILLENYGFEVIDLGKDVPEEEIVRRVKQENVPLVGLSALMTTTAMNMASTIKALRDEGLKCRVMVGGAVLNEEYANSIGADYYGKDAQEAVKIAQKFFNSHSNTSQVR
ncbi:MAG: dihydropteroate synthase [Thermoanaerobacteraceae bacterium]|nr:dihydropteroate synthase [Thermoanaerobacteraceae bacterium]